MRFVEPCPIRASSHIPLQVFALVMTGLVCAGKQQEDLDMYHG